MRHIACLLCLLACLTLCASRSVMFGTKGSPVTVSERHTRKAIPGGYSESYYKETAWSSGTREALGGSKVSEMSMGDLGGSLVIAIDQKAVTKGMKKYLMQAVSKFPTGTKGMKVAFIVYTTKPETIVSLKSGWSFRQVMKRVDRELALNKRLPAGAKILDYIGMEEAYNQLRVFAKATAPRIVLLLTSGSDAKASKTNEWRKKLMAEWISLAEVHVNIADKTYHVEGKGGHSGGSKKIGHGALVAGLLKTYAAGTIKFYKKIYGEIWEFYIVLKYYKKKYPTSWKNELKAWFKKKFGNTSKFSEYLGRTVSSGGGSVSPELAMRLRFQKKYGAKWKQHFHMWKLKKQYGSKWKIYWQQHLLKEKYGSRWLVKWKEQEFKKKYGAKWRFPYQKWYYKQYRGKYWEVAWKKWSYWKKYGYTRKFFKKYMMWFCKNIKKSGMKCYNKWLKANKKASKKVLLHRFHWPYYNTVYSKKKAVEKYHKWLFLEKYGKTYKPKYLAWLAKLKHKGEWRKYYSMLMMKQKYRSSWAIHWYKKYYKAKWEVHYKKYIFRRRFGTKWQRPYYKWYYFKLYPKNKAQKKYNAWLINYQKNYFKKIYGSKGKIFYLKWFKKWSAKKPSGGRSSGGGGSGGKGVRPGKPSIGKGARPISWYRKRYGLRWRYYYNLALFKKKYGKGWRIKFNRWLIKWRGIKIRGWKIAPWAKLWYKKKFGARWRFHYYQELFQRRYGKGWNRKFVIWQKKHLRKFNGKPLVVLRPKRWYKSKFGKNWLLHFTRDRYKAKFGAGWRIKFAAWKRKPKRRSLLIRHKGRPMRVRTLWHVKRKGKSIIFG